MTQEEQAVYDREQNQPWPVTMNAITEAVGAALEAAEAAAEAAQEALPRKSEIERPLVRLTYKQITENYDLLVRKLAYLVYPDDGRYYGDNYDPVDGREKALKSTISVLETYGSDFLYELVDQDVAREIARRKCSIVKLLGQQVVEMLKVAPSNPALLARVLAATGQMPPPCNTYEELKSWVETNCGPKLKPRVHEDCSLRVRFHNQEIGHCNYTVEKRVTRDYSVHHDVITQLAEEHKDWPSFLKAVEEHIKENAEDDLEPELEGQGYDYDDHVQENSTETETTILNMGTFQAAMADVMRRSQPQDVLNKMGLI